MKKTVSILMALMLCTVLAVTASAAAEPFRLYDGADLLTDAEESELSEKLDSVSEAYKVDLIIVTVDSLEGASADDVVQEVYDEAALGYGESRDGVMLLVAMTESEYRILSNGTLGAAAVDDEDIESIGNTVAESLGDGEYVTAFNAFIDECEYQINGEINGFPFDYTTNLLISLGVGIVAALIVTGVMKGQLKSVEKQFAAAEYTKKDSMQVTASTDLFLYSVVDRRKKESESSDSSSGATRHVGGGKF